MIHPVAVTIVANNYVPLARTLCHSFLEHHPNGRFFVLIVDEPTPELDLSNEPYEIVRLADLALPNNEMFVYQYSILELSTAVKPFLLRHLLDKYQLETLLYLDPDILITAPLTSIFKSFSNSSVLLIPHMFESPPDDGKKPSETDIMHSGAYNLGFLGIRNDATVSRLLEWWSERLADKCVVDLANARFVDQRWMDLAPSYFEDVEILRDIAINVAYWNLHERKLTQKDGQYFINNVPLAFFHFSGFNPLKPDQLSKHQTRHVIADHPALEALTQDYADRLMRHGYEELTQLRNAYLTLTNGVKLGRITQYLTLKAIERGLMVPSPQKDPDAYCRFMMTPNWVLDRRGLAPLLFALSHLRTDVAAAFPQAFDSNGNLEGLLAWVKNTGGQEEDLTEIFNGFGKFLYHSGATQKALKCWRKREDLRKAYPYAFTTIEGSQEYSEWIKHFGTVEEGFGKDDGMLFLQSRKGALKVLMLYFQDPIVQKEFPFLFLDAQRTRYVSWCYYEVCYRDMVSPEDVAWFDGFAESNKEVLMALTFGHSAWLHASLVGGGTVFNLNHLKDMLIANKVNFSDQDLVRLYASNLGISLLTQAEQFYLHSQDLRDKFPKAFESADNLEPLVKHLSLSFPDAASVAPPSLIWLKYSNRIRWALRKMGMKRVRKPVPLFKVIQNTQQLEAGSKKGLTERMQREYQEFRQSKPGVNLLGYFHSTTGMGESVRSMARTLAGGGVPFRRVPLSFYHLRPELDLNSIHDGELLKSYDPAYKTNVIVSNGDDYYHVRSRVMYSLFKNKTNIGYWVWETETLPKEKSDCRGLSAIWTPSEYSASAIRKSVDIPVNVVPHVLDPEELKQAVADRAHFLIPEDLTAYGYFFDCKSVMERKNPMGLIRAFREAFGEASEEAVLVLKISSVQEAPKEYSKLQQAAQGLNVVWITDILSRAEVLNLMKSLDVYVSLHRSEGFGLTMAESMAMGIPVVATGYSGNMEFMDDRNSYLVHNSVIETDRAHGAYPAGTRWAEPDTSQAAQYLRRLLNQQERERMGVLGQESVLKRLSPEHIGERVAALLETRE